MPKLKVGSLKDEISAEDCPRELAEAYPGKYNKNNLGGSTQTKQEYKKKAVQDWVANFGDKNSYQNTSLANKTRYLVLHLKNLNVKYKEAQKLLVEAEVEEKKEDREKEEKEREECCEGDENRGQEYSVGEKSGANEGGEGEMEETGELPEVVQSTVDEDMMDFEDEVEAGRNIDFEDKQNSKEASEESDSDDDCIVKRRVNNFDSKSTWQKRASINFELKKYMEKTDIELFESDLKVPEFVEKSKKYKKRKLQYIEQKVNSYENSQEILENFSQAPSLIEEALRRRLVHLTNQEKSARLLVKTLSDTLARLKLTPGREARKQELTILAAVSHHRWGAPALQCNTSWRQDKEAREMKVRLLTGADQVLTPSEKPKRQIYPVSVEKVAEKHWMDTTIPEPAVKRRMKRKEKTLGEGEQVKEIVPTRWQHLSMKEQYSNFKEVCKNEVKEELTKQAEEDRAKVEKRPDSEDKARRLEMLENLPSKFPGEKWYKEQMPPEVKPLCDHTTGLCRVCEAAQLNYNSLAKTLKRLCSCGTRMCSKWVCLCKREGEEEDREEGVCSCSCYCDQCQNCQVNCDG